MLFGVFLTCWVELGIAAILLVLPGRLLRLPNRPAAVVLTGRSAPRHVRPGGHVCRQPRAASGSLGAVFGFSAQLRAVRGAFLYRETVLVPRNAPVEARLARVGAHRRPARARLAALGPSATGPRLPRPGRAASTTSVQATALVPWLRCSASTARCMSSAGAPKWSSRPPNAIEQSANQVHPRARPPSTSVSQ